MSTDTEELDRKWRALASQGKDLEAANLLLAAIAEAAVEGGTAYFHAGQEFACAGEEHYAKAIDCLKRSYKLDNAPWNAYVDGTIAFLVKEPDVLDNAISKIENDQSGRDFFRVLGKLKSGLGRELSYKDSYDG